MVHAQPACALFDDLRALAARHREQVTTLFQPLTAPERAWRPAPREWSVGQCFDHLNLTYRYYAGRIAGALSQPDAGGPALYRPSGWGRVYMFFALNPRFSFPAAAEITPAAAAPDNVLRVYLEHLDRLCGILDDGAAHTRLGARVPIERGVTFNLGDCLTILVHHDEVHFLQAARVLAALRARPQAH